MCAFFFVVYHRKHELGKKKEKKTQLCLSECKSSTVDEEKFFCQMIFISNANNNDDDWHPSFSYEKKTNEEREEKGELFFVCRPKIASVSNILYVCVFLAREFLNKIKLKHRLSF